MRSAPTSCSPGQLKAAAERQESARARGTRMQHRRVASCSGGLDGLSPPHHAPIPCQSVPGPEKGLSAIALCSRPEHGSLTYPMVRTRPRESANPTGIQMTDPPCQCDSVYVSYRRCVPASGVTQQQSGAQRRDETLPVGLYNFARTDVVGADCRMLRPIIIAAPDMLRPWRQRHANDSSRMMMDRNGTPPHPPPHPQHPT